MNSPEEKYRNHPLLRATVTKEEEEEQQEDCILPADTHCHTIKEDRCPMTMWQELEIFYEITKRASEMIQAENAPARVDNWSKIKRKAPKEMGEISPMSEYALQRSESRMSPRYVEIIFSNLELIMSGCDKKYNYPLRNSDRNIRKTLCLFHIYEEKDTKPVSHFM
jgi:hypothetical protein